MQAHTWQTAALATLDSLQRALSEKADRCSPHRLFPFAQSQAKMLVRKIAAEMPAPYVEAKIDKKDADRNQTSRQATGKDGSEQGEQCPMWLLTDVTRNTGRIRNNGTRSSS